MTLITIVLSAVIIATLSVLGYTWWRYLQQRNYSTELKKVTIKDVFSSWLESTTLAAEASAQRDELLREIDAADRAAILDDLVALEQREFSARYPLTHIRREMMASVDRRALNEEVLRLPENVRKQIRESNPEILQDDKQTRRYIAANELRLMILREYARQRFGDFAKPDWFDVYQQASRIKQRSIHRMLENGVPGDDPDLNLRQHAIQLVDEKLREHLLTVPPGTTFEQLSNPK